MIFCSAHTNTPANQVSLLAAAGRAVDDALAEVTVAVAVMDTGTVCVTRVEGAAATCASTAAILVDVTTTVELATGEAEDTVGAGAGGGVAESKSSLELSVSVARRLESSARAELMPARMLSGAWVLVALKVSGLARLVICAIADETPAVILLGGDAEADMRVVLDAVKLAAAAPATLVI